MQAVQVLPDSWKPSPQVIGEQEVEPRVVVVVPAEQGVQEDDLAAEENEPRGHFWQAAPPFEYSPALQAVQVLPTS